MEEIKADDNSNAKNITQKYKSNVQRIKRRAEFGDAGCN